MSVLIYNVYFFGCWEKSTNLWLIRVHENVHMHMNQMWSNVRLIEILHINQAIIIIIVLEQ